MLVIAASDVNIKRVCVGIVLFAALTWCIWSYSIIRRERRNPKLQLRRPMESYISGHKETFGVLKNSDAYLSQYSATEARRQHPWNFYRCGNITKSSEDFPKITANQTDAMLRYRMPKDFFYANFSHIERYDEIDVLITPKNVCEGRVDYLLMVLGAVGHLDLRTVIRQTWGNVKWLKGKHIELVFVHGKDNESKIDLAKESDRFDDIVQFNFWDTYRNLTVKTLLSFRWVLTYCAHAKIVIRHMDDVFLNVHGVVDVLQHVKHQDVYRGCLNMNSTIFDYGRWRFSSEVAFDNPKYFSPYIFGSSIVLSVGVIKKFYYLSCFVPEVWPDDGHLGYLALLMGIPKTDDRKYCSLNVMIHFKVHPDTAFLFKKRWGKVVTSLAKIGFNESEIVHRYRRI